VIDRIRSEAERVTVRMPFERGAPRAALIARRRFQDDVVDIAQARARIAAAGRRFDLDQAFR
jgi:rRNA processing protein Krr1/Pno1